MSQSEYRTVQKHSHNCTLLVTIPAQFADAISKNSVVKITLENNCITMKPALLKLAFVADPATRWVWSDPQKYLSHFSSFARAFGGKAFAYESAHYVGNYSGAALWLPPKVHPDVEQLVALLQSTGSDDAKKYGLEMFEKMGSYHPKEPHWYLPLLGVDPLHHGKGLGSALPQRAIVTYDQDNKYRRNI